MATDLELLERWRNGDGQAGSELFQRHFNSIYGFFANKISHDVEELVQSTFLACVKSRDRFQERCSFRTYLFTIARNELYRVLRKRQRNQDNIDFGVTSLAALTTSVRTKMARRQDGKLLVKALRQLPLEQQVMLELHYWENMKAVELAQVFQIEASSARARLFRARKVLRDLIVEMAKEPSDNYQTAESIDAWARSLQEHYHAGVEST